MTNVAAPVKRPPTQAEIALAIEKGKALWTLIINAGVADMGFAMKVRDRDGFDVLTGPEQLTMIRIARAFESTALAMNTAVSVPETAMEGGQDTIIDAAIAPSEMVTAVRERYVPPTVTQLTPEQVAERREARDAFERTKQATATSPTSDPVDPKAAE